MIFGNIGSSFWDWFFPRNTGTYLVSTSSLQAENNREDDVTDGPLAIEKFVGQSHTHALKSAKVAEETM